MEFKKYQHIERFGTTEVRDIEIGTCYVFPKVDGTNASVWLDDDGRIRAGSRNRTLELDNDNAGFYNAIINDNRISSYLFNHPRHRLFGEWLVPHTLKTYKEDAWRKFYIFDVCLDKEDNSLEYIPYNVYQEWLEEFNLDYIMPLKIIKNGSYENFVHELESNVFLVKDGMGTGEGVVIKNYDFYNQYKRQTWAKIVTSEFKEKHYKVMGCPQVENKMIEQDIVDTYITTALVEKEYAKIVNDNDGWQSRFIPQILGTVFYELINEEMWHIIKQFKNPSINFKTLNALTIKRVKEVKSEIFC